LVETTLNDYVRQIRGSRQDDGDGDGGAEAGGQDSDQVYNGVRRLLQNVFSGNLIGVIQEGVSIRSPGRVQEFFSDVMGALFGSNAVKGAGTIGVAIFNTTTVSPFNATALPPGVQQQYNPALVNNANGVVAVPQQVGVVPAVAAPVNVINQVPVYQQAGAGNLGTLNTANRVPAASSSSSQDNDEDDENDDF